MSTIQYQIEKDDLDELLKMTGAKTGVKAIRFLIEKYPELVKQHEELKKQHSEQTYEYRELKYKCSEFGDLLKFFQKVGN